MIVKALMHFASDHVCRVLAKVSTQLTLQRIPHLTIVSKFFGDTVIQQTIRSLSRGRIQVITPDK